MTRARRLGLRWRLLSGAVAGALVTGGILVAGFNLLLEQRLSADVDSLLHDRASAQLRTVSVIDGRLRVPEALDQGAPDTQTWIYAGNGAALERPAADVSAQRAADELAAGNSAHATVGGVDLRLYAVPIVQGHVRLGTLVVATSLVRSERGARTALVASLALAALVVAGVAALSWLLIGRALAPVARMTAAASEWGERDLSKRFLAGEPHDELTALAATFDALLDRVAASLSREQRITGEISHELRTPLAGILAETELALARERQPAELRTALATIRASALDLSRALEALMSAARAQSPSRGRGTDPEAAARRVAARGRAAARPEVQVEVTPAPKPLRVAADPDLVERALGPIVDNAIRHARSRVLIAVQQRAGQVLITVSDDGPGVDPAVREQMFEPGVSGPGVSGPGVSGPEATASGAGLGVPLARRLARAAGGEVDYVDQGPDGEAAFVVRLPGAPA